MPELIDREQAGKNICKYCASNAYCKEDDCMVYQGLRDTPTIQIEAEPVRHGRWNNTEETVWDAKEIDGKQQLEISIVAARCSACGHWSEQVNQFPPYMHYKFCPHCGARMDGGADNG